MVYLPEKLYKFRETPFSSILSQESEIFTQRQKPCISFFCPKKSGIQIDEFMHGRRQVKTLGNLICILAFGFCFPPPPPRPPPASPPLRKVH